MALGDHRHVTVKQGDTVVMSATPIPGNEELVSRTVDNLFKLGAEVVYDPGARPHVSGHASQEELKLLLNILQPKYFVPIHGEYRMLVRHARLAVDVGVESAPAQETAGAGCPSFAWRPVGLLTAATSRLCYRHQVEPNCKPRTQLKLNVHEVRTQIVGHLRRRCIAGAARRWLSRSIAAASRRWWAGRTSASRHC